ncbi:hypothetical protein ABVV53_15550 [Novosphingobium sp. RD2P27]|uniref:Uncharacterized protein n=1 Tax=Novosphingobium kalidii TaxID=3230299 RepID=A0ABV2D4S0_9SPHN
MLIRLAALGALGYVGYRYLRERPEQNENRGDVALAGGPLSEQATIQDSPDLAPAMAWHQSEMPRTVQ